MQSRIGTVALLAGLLSTGGCSTITTGTTQTVTIDTPFAAGAKCTLSDTEKRVWNVPSTPASLVVEKGDGPMTVICEKAGYHVTTEVVEEELQGMTFGNVLIGGGIGFIVDAASGAAQKYPNQIKVWMVPNKFASSDAKAEWQEAKTAWEKAEHD